MESLPRPGLGTIVDPDNLGHRKMATTWLLPPEQIPLRLFENVASLFRLLFERLDFPKGPISLNPSAIRGPIFVRVVEVSAHPPARSSHMVSGSGKPLVSEGMLFF